MAPLSQKGVTFPAPGKANVITVSIAPVPAKDHANARVKMFTNYTFGQLQDDLAIRFGKIPKLYFKGRRMRENETPEDMALTNECRLEAAWCDLEVME